MENRPTVEVAVCVMPDGNVTFTRVDQTSVNTVGKKWRESCTPELLEKHNKHKTQAGVVQIRMLSEDFMRVDKELKHDI